MSYVYVKNYNSYWRCWIFVFRFVVDFYLLGFIVGYNYCESYERNNV